MTRPFDLYMYLAAAKQYEILIYFTNWAERNTIRETSDLCIGHWPSGERNGIWPICELDQDLAIKVLTENSTLHTGRKRILLIKKTLCGL